MITVDRATFLALTFGMAACNTGNGPGIAAIEIPTQPVQPDAGRIEAKPPPEETKLRATTPTSEGAVATDDDDETPEPTAEGGGVIAKYDPSGCGWVDPAKVTRPTGTCSDDKATVPACPMGACSGFGFPVARCRAYRNLMKPKVAAAAMACLAKLPAKEQCDACKVYRCGDIAMKGSCPDPTADASCNQIRAKCPSVSMAECQRYLSGLTPQGRQQMVSCLGAKSGCGFGIFSCTESIF